MFIKKTDFVQADLFFRFINQGLLVRRLFVFAFFNQWKAGIIDLSIFLENSLKPTLDH